MRVKRALAPHQKHQGDWQSPSGRKASFSSLTPNLAADGGARPSGAVRGRVAGFIRRCQRSRWATLFCLALAISLGACQGIDTFEVIQLAVGTIPGAKTSPNLAASVDFGSFDPKDNPDLANARRSDIDSIRIREIWMRVKDPASGQDLTFIDAMDVYISAEGQGEKLVATGAGFAAKQSSTKLQHASSDLTDFALAPQMKIHAVVQGKAPPQTTRLEAKITMEVDVAVLGF